MRKGGVTMQGNKVEAVVSKVISKKNGNEYVVIKIQLADGYTKTVFCDGAETALLRAIGKI